MITGEWKCFHCGRNVMWDDYEWVDAYGVSECKLSHRTGRHDVMTTSKIETGDIVDKTEKQS